MDNSKRPLNPDFSLNQPRYQGAQILLTRKNFGCGSSREHAPWALDDYGFRAVIAPSFADIFFNNCYKNGLLPIVLTEEQVDQLFKEVEANEGYQLSIDLAEQTLTTPSGETFKFDITEHRKHCLLNGLDEIGLTLQHADEIRDFEEKRRRSQPWLLTAKQQAACNDCTGCLFCYVVKPNRGDHIRLVKNHRTVRSILNTMMVISPNAWRIYAVKLLKYKDEQ